MDMDWKLAMFIGFILGAVAVAGFLFFVSGVWAQSPPCPIGLTLKTIPTDASVGLLVKLYDGPYMIMEGVSNEYGEVLFDVGGLYECKEYTAVVEVCKDEPACTRSVSFNPSGFVDWDLSTVEVPCDCPSCATSWEAILAAFFGLVGGGFVMYIRKGKVKIDKDNIEEFAKYIPPGCGFKFWKGYNNKLYFTHLHRSPKHWHSQSDRHKKKYDHEGEENLFPDF